MILALHPRGDIKFDNDLMFCKYRVNLSSELWQSHSVNINRSFGRKIIDQLMQCY